MPKRGFSQNCRWCGLLYMGAKVLLMKNMEVQDWKIEIYRIHLQAEQITVT